MPEYMNPATGALFSAPVGGNYRGSTPRPQNQLADRGAFATPQDRSAFLSGGIGQWKAQQQQQASVASNVQLPSQPLSADKGAYATAQQRNAALNAGVQRAQVAQRPAQNVNMSRSFNPTADDVRRRGNVDFINAVRESGLQGATRTTQANPLYGPQSGGMANHPVNVFAREQAAATPKPTRGVPAAAAKQPQSANASRPAAANRAPTRMPATLNSSQGKMNRAGLGSNLMGPRHAAALATRGLGGIPGGLPPAATASATPAPVPQHGMQASAPPGARPRVPTAPSGIAIEDPFSSAPATAQRAVPAAPPSAAWQRAQTFLNNTRTGVNNFLASNRAPQPASAVAANPAAGGRRGRMQENRE